MAAATARLHALARSGSSVRGFLGWWRAGLAVWLPQQLRKALQADRERLLLLPQGDALQLRRQHDDAVLDVASLPLPVPATGSDDPLDVVLRDQARDMPRWLLLPASMGLRRNLTLPAAAAERLRDVLGFEIERQTPFSMADVLYDGHILQRRDDGQLQVELVVVPRAAFAAVAEQLGEVSPTLAGVDLADADGRTIGANLLPPAQRRGRQDAWRWWKLGFGLVGALTALIGLQGIVENRQAAAAALQASVDQHSEQARLVSVSRQRLVDAVDGAAYLQAQRNGRASSVEVMNALAERLPDGAYLEKLAIEGEQVTVIGLSNQAAALVGRLEGATQWDAPALAGALQQDPRTRMDRFTLVAQLRGAKQKEAANAAR